MLAGGQAGGLPGKRGSPCRIILINGSDLASIEENRRNARVIEAITPPRDPSSGKFKDDRAAALIRRLEVAVSLPLRVERC